MAHSYTKLMATGAHILDCDGTIAPYVEEAHGKCVANVLARLVHEQKGHFSQTLYDDIWEQELGRGINNFVRVYLDSIDQDVSCKIKKSLGFADGDDGLYVKIEDLYEEEYIRFSEDPQNGDYYRIRPGLKNVFEQATIDGIPVGVISNANQRVVEATLKATLKLAGMAEDGNLASIFTAVVGKDTVIASGAQAKPHPSAVYVLVNQMQQAIGKPIAVANSIGWGDTPTDYKAMGKAGLAWIVACNNHFHPANDLGEPDEGGLLRVGPEQDVTEVGHKFYQATIREFAKR